MPIDFQPIEFNEESGIDFQEEKVPAEVKQTVPAQKSYRERLLSDWEGRANKIANSGLGLPARSIYSVGQMAGAVGDVFGEAINQVVPEEAKSLAGDFARKAIEKGSIAYPNVANAVRGGVDLYGQFKQSNPNAARGIEQAVETATNIGGIIPANYGAKAGSNAIVNATKPLTREAIDRKIASSVSYGMNKGIGPSVAGKHNAPQIDNYYNKATNAVKTIVDNSNNLLLTDSYGNQVKGLPRTLKQFSEAIDQTKKQVYQKYHDMAVKAGIKGVEFDMIPVMKRLDEVSAMPDEILSKNDKRKAYPSELREYATKLKNELSELHKESPEIVEKRIQDLNNSLAGYYDGRVTKAKAQLDASVAQLMREQLDNSIMSHVGPGYQDLKNTYGSLKAIEKEVAHRAVVDARKRTKGLYDLTDVFTGGEIIGGILTMNPAMVAKGAAGNAISKYYKYLVSPNRNIKNMFSEVDSLVKKQKNDFKDVPNPQEAPSEFYEVGPVKSGRTVGQPYGPQASRLRSPKELPAGQGFILSGEQTIPDIIDAQFISRSRPVMALPPVRRDTRLALPPGQGFSTGEIIPNVSRTQLKQYWDRLDEEQYLRALQGK